MNPAKTQNPAANSTPTAEPPGSSPGVDNTGADHGDVTEADVNAALGLPPEGQDTETAEADDTDTAPEADETAPAETEPEAEADSGQPVEPAVESDTAAEPGEPPTEETDAPPEPAGEPEVKKGESLQQRIDQLTKARIDSEQVASQLREKLAGYEAQASSSLEPDSLANVDTPQELAAAEAKWVKLQKWALRNPDGGTMPDGKGGEAEFSREEVANIQSRVFGLLQESVPQRKEFLRVKAAADEQAARSYPWISDRTKGDGQMLQRALEALPQLRAVPEARIIAANALVGNKLRMAGIQVDDALIQRLVKEQKAKALLKPPGAAVRPGIAAPRAPAAPARMGTMPARRVPAAAASRAAEKKLISSGGSVADLAQYIAADMK